MDASRNRRAALDGAELRIQKVAVGKVPLLLSMDFWAACYGLDFLGADLETREIVEGTRPTMTLGEHVFAAVLGLCVLVIAKFGFGL